MQKMSEDNMKEMAAQMALMADQVWVVIVTVYGMHLQILELDCF